MSKLLTFGGRIAFFCSAVFVLSMPVFAQLTLRKAMDSDGDGKADFSVFRPSNNYWYIAKTTGGYIAQQWGLASDDFMTPGDYDGG